MNNIKKYLPGFLVFLITVSTHAQTISNSCASPSAQYTIHANNIQARLLNGGDLFWDFQKAQFTPGPVPNNPSPSTIFVAGMWIGGMDTEDNLKLAASTYRVAGFTDYWAGPLDENGITHSYVCKNWDRFFVVKRPDIQSFIDNLPNLINDPLLAITSYKSIMSWPATGNPYFAGITGFTLPNTSEGLAAFHDQDLDGKYNPLLGDYPIVKLQGIPEFIPQEIAWCVFNDEGAENIHGSSFGQPVHAEIQLTVWAFSDSSNPLINNTLFTSHRIINRSSTPLDSCFWGMWADFDLGCYTDDYIGCMPSQDAFFVYNQDAIDGSVDSACVGDIPTFAGHPPVQTASFLNRTMDKFICYNRPYPGNPPPGTIEPEQPNEYYHLLTGSWRDATPLTKGGNGYNPSSNMFTDYAFPDLPSDPNGWSMCAANLPYGDRISLGVHQIGQWLPGQVEEIAMSWTVHYVPDGICETGSISSDLETLRTWYNNGFADIASPLGSVMTGSDAGVHIFPNPATNLLILQYNDPKVHTIHLYSINGQCVQTLNTFGNTQMELNISQFHPGLYLIQMRSDDRVTSRKVAILR